MRRPTLHAILALVLVAVFAAPAAAASPAEAGRETLTGTLEALYVDDLHAPGATDVVQFDLRTEHGTVPVAFPGRGPRRLSGAKVTLTGTRRGGVLEMATSTPGTDLRVLDRAAGSSPAGESVQLDGYRRREDVRGRPDQLHQPHDPAVDPVDGPGRRHRPTSSLKAFYEEESKGRMTVGATVYGWYTIDAKTTGCDWRTWHTLGWNAATAAGVNLSAFTNVIFIWPRTSDCGFAGVGYVPGAYTYINGYLDTQVLAHEVGHNLGLGHANARNCVVGGTRVTIAADASCTSQGYADPFSTMGNKAARHNHGSQLGELGWLDASQKVVGTPGNTYTISPYFGTGAVKLVRIPRGDGSFFDLDFRVAYGASTTTQPGRRRSAASPSDWAGARPARPVRRSPRSSSTPPRRPRTSRTPHCSSGRRSPTRSRRSRLRPSRSGAAASWSASPRASRPVRPGR